MFDFSGAYLSFPFLLSPLFRSNRLSLSSLKFLPWSIYGSSHDESVRKGIPVNPKISGNCKVAASIAKGRGVKEPWYDHGDFTVLCGFGFAFME